MKTVAIQEVHGRLVSHYFDSEEEALKIMPYIKRWERESFDSDRIRYHSKSAIRYWKNRNINDPIAATSVVHKNGKKVISYS